MKQRTIKLTFVFALMVFLSLGNMATASAQGKPDVLEVPFADLQSPVENPCTGATVQNFEGTFVLTILNVEVETPSGFVFENELQQVRGTAVGEDEDGNIYSISLHATIDDECGIGDVDPNIESCLVIHATFRSRTTSNFTESGVLKLVGGQEVLTLQSITCQSTGTI